MSFSVDLAEKALHAERELQNLQTKFQLLQEFTDNLKQQLDSTTDTLQQSRHEFYDIKQNNESLQYDYDNLKDEVERLKKEKLELADIIKEKNTENYNLKDTIQNLKNASFTDQSPNKSLNEIKLKEIQLKFEETRFNQERTLYTKQIELLNQQLQDKNNELLSFRKQSDDVVLQSNLKIEKQSHEINDLKLQINSLNKENASKKSSNNDLSKKLLDLQVDFNKLECSYNKECHTNRDIIKLLTNQNDDLKKEIINRNKDIEQLRSIVQKGSEAHKELEMEFLKMKDNYLVDIKTLEEECFKLTKELEDAKSTIVNNNNKNIEKMFETHFPFASETNRKLNNKINLSDLYKDFIKVKQELFDAVKVNEELNSEIASLHEQLDESKPVLYKNLQNSEQIINENNQLRLSLKEVAEENHNLVKERDDYLRTISSLNREKQRYDKENANLSMQINYLLRSAQEAKGFSVPAQSDYSGIICFKDIVELQEKNRTLMSLLQQLEEENERMCNNSEFGELKSHIEAYKREIEDLKSQIKQNPESIDQSGDHTSSPFKRGLDSNTDLIKENKELKLKVEKYFQDIETIRQKFFDDIRKLENDKNELISRNAILNADITRLNADFENKKRHEEDLNSHLEKYQNENVELRERNIKLNSNVENMEKSILTLKNQIDSLKENIKLSDNKMQMAFSERDLFKNSFNNIISENAKLSDDVENLRKRLYSTQAIQDNINRNESATIINLTSQVENMKKENQFYQQKIEKQEDRLKTLMDNFTERYHSLQVLLEKERHNYIELQRENFELKLNSQQNLRIIEKSETFEPNEPISIVEQNSLKKQLQSAQDEIKILKGKLNNSEVACENMKSINNSLEENLNQLMSSSEDFKTKLETETKSKIDQVKNLLAELNDLRVQYDKMVTEKDAEFDELKKTIVSNAQRIEQLQKLLTEANEATERARQNESQLLDDLKVQSVLAAKAQEDYEAEIKLRSGDAKKIFQLNINVEELHQQLVEKETEISKMKNQLVSEVDALNKEKITLNEECEKFKNQCKTLEHCNDSLMSELEQLNNKIIALQNNSNLFLMDENNQKESAERLTNVIKFLRQEKFQLQSKCSQLADSEGCLKIEIENYKKEIENLKCSLENEKQSTNRLNSMSEFNEIISKAELVPILTEDNSRLRSQLLLLEKRNAQIEDEMKKVDQKEKSLKELSAKVETESVNNEALKKEIELWKSKLTSLTQQLKNSDSDSLKRLLSEKDLLNRQNQVITAELNKMKADFDSKTRLLNQQNVELAAVKQQMKKYFEDNEKINQELTNANNNNQKLQNTVLQLKALARKYRSETTKNKANTDLVDKESQCDIVVEQSNLDTEAKLKEKLEQNTKLESDFKRLSEENEAIKNQASEKVEKAKNIAQQAKLRISELIVDKNSLNKEKELLTKENEELKLKITALESSVEQNNRSISLLKSQYDSKLQAATKQIEDLTSKPPPSTSVSPSPSLSAIPLTSNVIPVGIATNITPPASSSIRHSVHPQNVTTSTILSVVKTTPTASIKPLTVATTRSPSTSSRPIQVLVLPTATDDVLSQSSLPVPQATVQPTQTSQSIPSSTSISSTIPELSGTYSFDISEPSTSQCQNTSSFSTSNKKRSHDSILISSDEPSSSNAAKKVKKDEEVIDMANDEDEEESDEDFNEEIKDDSDVEVNVEDSADRMEQADSAPESGHADDKDDADNDNVKGDFDSAAEDDEDGKGYDEFISYDDEEVDEEAEADYDDEEGADEESDIECVDENEEDEEEDEEDVEDEDDQIQESSEIEVIAIDDSDEEHEASNLGVGDEVSSSNAQSSNQRETLTDISTTDSSITTTNITDQSGIKEVDLPGTSASSSSNAVQATDSEADKQTVTSQSSIVQSNAEPATSTSSTLNVTMPASNRFQRRQPVTWPRAGNRTMLANPNRFPAPSNQDRTNTNTRRLNIRNRPRGINNQGRGRFRY